MSHVIRLDSSHNFALIKKHNIMKRTIVLFTALFVAITASFAFTGVSKGDDIPIPLESKEFEEDTIIIRAPVIPIEASVDPVQSIITVSFLSNVGFVSIEVTNLITGGVNYYYENSNSGCAILPFSGVTGYYIIRFMTDDGRLYYGYFSI